MQREGQRYYRCFGCKRTFWRLDAYRRHKRAASHPDAGFSIWRTG